MMMTSEATCVVKLVTIDGARPPPFSDGFVQHLRRLEKAHDASVADQEMEYLNFVRAFGTHFPTKARFGGRVVVEGTFSRDELDAGQIEKERKCREGAFGKTIPFGDLPGSRRACASTVMGTNTVMTVGSKPIARLAGELQCRQKYTLVVPLIKVGCRHVRVVGCLRGVLEGTAGVLDAIGLDSNREEITIDSRT